MEKIKLNPNRNYGIDFLRILSMLFVLLLHILKQGGILNSLEKLSVGYNMAWFVEICAYCAVNCYALISGFIGCTSKKQKYSNIISLYIQTAFYAVLATGIFYVMSPEEIGEKAFIKAALPFGFNVYWYFTAYFCMFFFTPFFNKILEVCDKKQLTGLVVSMIVFFSFIPLIFKSDVYYTNNGYTVMWLSVLYIIGGYVRKFQVYKKFKSYIFVISYFAGVLITWGQKILTEFLKLKINGETVNEGLFIKYTSPTMVLCAVSLLCFFANVNFGSIMQKITAIFSPFAFSVYLIHTAPFVWSKVMKNRFVAYAELNPFIMILAVLGTSIGIFLLCSLIDFVRSQLFKLLKIKELSIKIEEVITKTIKKVEYKFTKEKETIGVIE